MRIVQVSPWYYPHLGGVESHVRALSRELAARGHDVTVVTTRYDPSLPQEEIVDGVRVVRVKPRAILMRTPIVPQTRSRLRDLPTDVLHAHSPPPLAAQYAARVAKASGRPFVVTYHCDVELASPWGAFAASVYRRTLGASTLRRASKVVVTTRTYAATSRAVWQYNPVVIPNAVNGRRFHPDVDGSAVRERLGASDGRPLLLLVCRIVPHKGIEHFIEAARFIPEATFAIAGEGPLLGTMRRFAATMGVADRVRFLGRVPDEDLAAVYAACDVFVLPSVSRLEAFGIAALEAMATAKPVVVSDIPGVREVIEDGREGLLADPVNPQDLAEKILRLLADPEARKEMGRRGREKVLAEFTIDRVTDRVEDVYRSIAVGATKARP
ncbi:MAG TPA: glycosyltransferase family 4 protein [Thermoplasmata archaeon]|nr:glycosyltransferase family 4 protein [Thermoplasmata archaeon]